MDVAHTDDGITLVSRDSPRLDFQRDLFSPVSRLPVEILEIIFIHIARDSYKTHSIATPIWVDVSYVCSHWRNVALNCQILWTYIPTTSQRWTQELLVRSQNAPLKILIKPSWVYVHVLASRVLPIVEQLMNHSQRIEELYLDLFAVTYEYTYQPLINLFPSHLPCLHHLEISNLYLPEDHWQLPFEGNTPALRTLILGNCWIPWTSLELGALTTLHLHSTKLPAFFKTITMSEFLVVLRRMPHLVQLSVHGGTLPSAHEFLSKGEFNTASIIKLPHLSNMSIEAPISTVNALLSCVDILLTTKVELGCEYELRSTWHDVTRLASLLAQRINPSYDPTRRCSEFSLADHQKHHVEGDACLQHVRKCLFLGVFPPIG